MVDQPTRYRSYESDIDNLEQDILGASLRPRPYAFGRSASSEHQSDDSVPLFLSDPDGDPDPAEFDYRMQLRGSRRLSISAKILMATVAASAVAVVCAWFSSDATRDVLMSAKASIATVLPVPSAAAQSETTAQATTQLTPRDVQLKDPTRLSGPASRTPGANEARAPQQVAMLPSREEISSAYQAALQNQAPAAAIPLAAISPVAIVPPPAAAPSQPAQPVDPEEVANLMQRSRTFLASGDLMSARLLLERAAELQNADAALLLAQTYDPDVLGTSDVRNTTPEPAKARAWYQKAAQLGSADAQRRLAQLSN